MFCHKKEKESISYPKRFADHTMRGLWCLFLPTIIDDHSYLTNTIKNKIIHSDSIIVFPCKLVPLLNPNFIEHS